MHKYVDADKLRKTMSAAYWDENIHSAKDDPCVIDAMIDWAIRQVKDAPTEDVVPVVHAYWIGGDYGDWFCSECDSVLRFYGEPKHLRYCYRCGAKMDAEVNDG